MIISYQIHEIPAVNTHAPAGKKTLCTRSSNLHGRPLPALSNLKKETDKDADLDICLTDNIVKHRKKMLFASTVPAKNTYDSADRENDKVTKLDIWNKKTNGDDHIKNDTEDTEEIIPQDSTKIFT
jgi:hypothetical protein